MKKQTKGKRTPPRRKPIRKPKAQKLPRYSEDSQELIDHSEAHERAMEERMPPTVLADYLRLKPIDDDDLSPADDARMGEILEEYDGRAPPEVMERHLADIAREREQAAAQDQQDGTVV